MRDLYMKNGQGFILMYSITAPQSFEELPDLHEQIVRVKGSTKVPIVLVGNKCDLINDRAISQEQGLLLAQSIGGVAFFETSARFRINIDEVFADLIRQIHVQFPDSDPQKKRRKCTIL